MNKTLIKVEQRHIDQGRRHNCNYCPVALAIKDTISPDYTKRVSVSPFDVGIGGRQFYLPFELTEFIQRFDRLGVAEPIEFELDLPPKFL
jgi:hypothetical protein